MDNLDEIIEQAVSEPLKASGDGQSAEGHTLPDLIAIDKHLAAKQATTGTNHNGGSRSLWGGLRAARAITGGPGPQ